MLAAAGAWNGLAAELRATALGYSSVLSELTSQAWHGPASASMAAAVAPYVAWLSTSAAQAEESAAQAEAAVAAYEAAFAATVPPPVIAANRAQLMALIATNFFGQNTPAIAATEAQYAEMWAQDAAAMYGYAGASAVASQLTPFHAPRQATDPAGPPAQSAAVSQAAATSAGTGQSTVSQLMSAVPGTLQGLATPAASTPQAAAPAATGGSALENLLNSPIWNNFGHDATLWNSIFASGFYMPGRYLGTATKLISLNQPADGGAPGAAEGAIGAAAGSAAGALGNPLGSATLVNSVTATMGKGGLVGPLSVPQGWAGPAPLQTQLVTTSGSAPVEAPPTSVTASTPPVPLGHMGAQGEGRAVPQYGFRVLFVARPPAAG
jgi:PPE-repeat protein